MKLNRLFPDSGYASPLLSYQALYVLMFFCMLWSLCYLRPFYDGYGDTPSYFNAWLHLKEFRPDGARTPVYPLVITAFRVLFGLDAGGMMTAIFQWLVFLVAVNYFRKSLLLLGVGLRGSFLATAVFALCPGVFHYNICYITESLAVSGMIFFMYFIIRLGKTPEVRDIYLAAVTLTFLVFLRPAFIYLLPLTALYAGVLWLRFRREAVRTVRAGLISLAVVVGLYAGYGVAVNRCYGLHTISYISVYNNLYLIREAKLMTPSSATTSAIREIIETNVTDGESVDFQSIEREIRPFFELDLAEQERYADSVASSNKTALLKYLLLSRFNQFSKYPALICYIPGSDHRSGEYRMSAAYIPIQTFLWFAVIYAVWLCVYYRKRREIPVVSMMLLAVSMGLAAVVFVGAMGDWSRLMAPALPSIALMGAQLFSQFRFVGKFL
jgi:hypothetical protein